jgi:prephenate dehydrogenase
MSRVGIIGTGLIGASIGLALREQGRFTVGWDHDQASLDLAADRGAVTPVADVSEAVDDVEIVILAGPLGANIELLGSISTSALVTDVTSVKRPVLTAVPPGMRFVGGHPLAGREHAGPAAASPALFRGAPWVICPDGGSRSDLDVISEMVISMGANPIKMTAAEHDRAIADTSHLPHLIAVALTNLVARDPLNRDLIAGSFRDLTRVAGADTGWWPDILTANSDEVEVALDALVREMQAIAGSARAGDYEAIGHEFESARRHRLDMAPSLERVMVVLQDRPGELARVGHAFEKSHVDVRDLQLRHAEHGGGGILTITVRPEEGPPLRAALSDEGFDTE